MDDKGNLYWEENGKLFNEKKTKEIKVRPDKLAALTPEEYGHVKGMNRAERRKWFRDNK